MFSVFLGLLGTVSMAGLAAGGLGGGAGSGDDKKTPERAPETLSASGQKITAAPTPAPEPTAPLDDTSPSEVLSESGQVITAAPAPAPTPTDPPAETETPSSDLQDMVISMHDASVVAGRTSTLSFDDPEIVDIEILTKPAHGNVTVNPDKTLALVLGWSSSTADLSFDVRLTYADGQTEDQSVEVEVHEGLQQGGWGQGQFYMLETDENDDIVIEHGDNHRKIYISGDEEALSRADIAALEGISVDKVTTGWLAKHPEYGSDPEMALDAEAGLALSRAIIGGRNDPSSNWLLFERGYEYEAPNGLFQPGNAVGESELHPLYVGAYGEGDKPVLTSTINVIQAGNGNMVVQDIVFGNGFNVMSGSNYLMNNVSVTGHDAATVANVDMFTFRNGDVLNVTDEAAWNGETWSAHGDRISGFFSMDSNGLLIENSLFDHNGWEDGYTMDNDADNGQPPSQYSHNIYLQSSNLDVTLRDNIIARGAGSGVQFRQGGFVEDNLLLDNNGAIFIGKGGQEADGNYSLVNGNVITSAGHRDAEFSAALSRGITNQGQSSTLTDNIVTHLANPDDPAELLEKDTSQYALVHNGPSKDESLDVYYDDTIVYNWASGDRYEEFAAAEERNTDGLNEAQLDQTTIQRFAAQVLGDQNATIDDLLTYLRAAEQANIDTGIDADAIIAYFQNGFGIDTSVRTDAETLRFIPDALGDGMRWDNRLNWSTDDLPGTQAGDSVDLGGNWVQYGGNTAIENLDFGAGGRLLVTGGYLDVSGEIDGRDALLSIDGAGQVWTNGTTSAHGLEVEAMGGRFANTGELLVNDTFEVNDNAQVLLASDDASFYLGPNGHLGIIGGDARVGFDGDSGKAGVFLLDDTSEVSFTAKDGLLGQISEFRSGHFGETDMQTGINLGGSEIVVNAGGLGGSASTQWTLMQADEIIGNFDSFTLNGLDNSYDASILVDYNEDTVTLHLGAAGKGSGSRNIYTVGDEMNAADNNDIWQALTAGQGTYSEMIEDIPEEDMLIDE